MENEMIMNHVEENNNVELMNEKSTAGEKAIAAAIIVGGVAAVGAAVYGIKVVAGKIKDAWNNRKAKKIREAEFVDISDDQNDSEESD